MLSVWKVSVIFLAIFSLTSCLRCSISQDEYDELYTLYNSTNGHYWRLETIDVPWKFPSALSEPCSHHWVGLNCSLIQDSFCNIIGIHLGAKNLTGVLPSTISNFSNLYHLDFNSNHIYGNIPSTIGCITSLKILYLFADNFTGNLPIEFSNLQNLEVLDVFGNDLSGRIPNEYSTLVKLKLFGVNNNQFSGPLPSTLGNMSSLIQLYLSSNAFSGEIPPSLGNLNNLQLLEAGFNSFTGKIPSSLGHLSSVSLFYLFNNFLSGPIPSSFQNLSTVNVLGLNKNFLSGNFPCILSHLQKLQVLDINTNFFTGLLPDCISSFNALQDLYVNSNNLFGSLPSSLTDMRNIQVLDLSTNLFSSTLSSSFHVLIDSLILFNISDNFFSGKISWLSSASSHLKYLDVAINAFSGTIPSISHIINLRVISFSQNCFSGSISSDLCQLGDIEVLLMDNLAAGRRCFHWRLGYRFGNIMKGSIPSCLWDQTGLRTLHLIGNGFTGKIYDFSSTIDKESRKNRSSSLRDLALVSNYVSGSIPRDIQLKNMTNLLLSFNKFSGTLLSDFNEGRLMNDGLSTVNLSSNRLSGVVSPYLSDLRSMDVVSGNIFSCKSDYRNDVEGKIYSCGSLVLSQAYLSLVAVLIVGIVLFALTSFSFDVFLLRIGCVPIEWLEKRSFFSMLSLKRIILSFFYFVFLFTLFCLLRIHYFDFATHTFEYGWSFTLSNLHGLVSFVISFILLLFSLIVFSMILLDSSFSMLYSSLKTSMKSLLASIFSWSWKSSAISSFDTTSSHNAAMKRESFINSSILASFLFVFVNICCIALVNAFYVVFVLQFATVFMRFALSLLLGLFKAMWIPFSTMILFTYIPQIPAYEKISLEVIIGVFSFLICPLIIAMLTDVNCFFYAVFGVSSINFEYETVSIVCLSSRYSDFSHCVEVPAKGYSSITPPWIYSFQCGSNIVMAYSSVFFYSYVFTGVILPMLQCLILFKDYSYRRAFLERFPFFIPVVYQSYSHVFFNEYLVQRLADIIRKSCDWRSALSISHFLRHIAIMLTFGTAFPPLGILIVFSIAIEALMMRFQLGTLYEDVSKNCHLENNKIWDILSGTSYSHEETISIVRRHFPFYLGGILLFWTVLWFDMIADVYSSLVGGVIVLVSIIIYGASFGLIIPSHRSKIVSNSNLELPTEGDKVLSPFQVLEMVNQTEEKN